MAVAKDRAGRSSTPFSAALRFAWRGKGGLLSPGYRRRLLRCARDDREIRNRLKAAVALPPPFLGLRACPVSRSISTRKPPASTPRALAACLMMKRAHYPASRFEP